MSVYQGFSVVIDHIYDDKDAAETLDAIQKTKGVARAGFNSDVITHREVIVLPDNWDIDSVKKAVLKVRGVLHMVPESPHK